MKFRIMLGDQWTIVDAPDGMEEKNRYCLTFNSGLVSALLIIIAAISVNIACFNLYFTNKLLFVFAYFTSIIFIMFGGIFYLMNAESPDFELEYMIVTFKKQKPVSVNSWKNEFRDLQSKDL